ncbi:hypothetical protein ACTMU2_31810 [Cupriavidus basilensis]
MKNCTSPSRPCPLQVRQLENHVGLPLFEQLGKKIYLTPAGHEMLHYSRSIIQQFRGRRRDVAAQGHFRRPAQCCGD